MATLVIGYGNPLRQDDGLGWHVAERLQREFLVGVDVVACHQLTPELAEAISQADAVIFVDARRGIRPGRVLTRRVRPRESVASGFSHFAVPEDLLGLAAYLYRRCPKARLIQVGGQAFDHGPELSPPAAAAVEAVLVRVGLLARAVGSDPSGTAQLPARVRD